MFSDIDKIYAEEGYVTRFLRNFLSHSDKNFRRGTPLGVTDFGYPQVLCLRGLCHNFSTNFLSHVAKNAVGDSLCLSLIWDNEKVWMRWWWAESIKIFRRYFLVSQNRNISLRNIFVLGFRKILIANKFMDKKGGVSRFPSKFFVSQCRKSS